MSGVISGINSIFQLIKNLLLFYKLREKIKYGTDYYFEEYKKQITLYKNGHGILSTTFKIKVINPEKFTSIRRKLNIADGKKNAHFKSLDEMLKTDKEKRFTDFGFWFCSDSNVITGVKEFYFSDNDYSKEDKAIKNNPKELRWIFKLNNSKIKKNHTYTMGYAISVPGMFPISNGVFDEENNPFDDGYDDFSSELKVVHAIKKVIYTVAIEKGIQIEDDLKCVLIDHKKDGSEKTIPLDGIMRDSVFYDKYTYIIDNPHINSTIKINWNIVHNEKNKADFEKIEACV